MKPGRGCRLRRPSSRRRSRRNSGSPRRVTATPWRPPSAGISRTLLYRSFRNKEELFLAVFAHWLVARHPAARKAAAGAGRPYDRLLGVCRTMVLEPWDEMARAPMASEFHDVCGRLDPALEALHRRVALECVTAVLGDGDSAAVFLLALDGLLADAPTPAVLEGRIVLLASRFAPHSGRRQGR